MRKENISSKYRILFISILSVLIVFSGSSAGLDSFMSLTDSISVEKPTLNLNFNKTGLSWMSDSGGEVNLSERSEFNYSFSNDLTWYNLNVSLVADLENTSKVSNLTGFTFEAYDSSNRTLDSCSSSIDTTGEVECDSLISTDQEVHGFGIEFQKDSIKTLRLKESSRIELEAD